jgi:hypothetical protein
VTSALPISAYQIHLYLHTLILLCLLGNLRCAGFDRGSEHYVECEAGLMLQSLAGMSAVPVFPLEAAAYLPPTVLMSSCTDLTVPWWVSEGRAAGHCQGFGEGGGVEGGGGNVRRGGGWQERLVGEVMMCGRRGRGRGRRLEARGRQELRGGSLFNGGVGGCKLLDLR